MKTLCRLRRFVMNLVAAALARHVKEMVVAQIEWYGCNFLLMW